MHKTLHGMGQTHCLLFLLIFSYCINVDHNFSYFKDNKGYIVLQKANILFALELIIVTTDICLGHSAVYHERGFSDHHSRILVHFLGLQCGADGHHSLKGRRKRYHLETTNSCKAICTVLSFKNHFLARIRLHIRCYIFWKMKLWSLVKSLQCPSWNNST